MEITTILILLGSLGFLLIGLVSLLSKNIKEYFKESGVYLDADKFMKYNGVFNLSIGIIGIFLGLLNSIISDKSKYIIIIYIISISILAIIQKLVLKKYRKI